MKLHVFHDSHGFFLNLTVTRVTQGKNASSNIFLNLDKKTIYPNEGVTYLKKSISSYRKAVRNLPDLESVTFYPFDYTASYFLRELKSVQPGVRVEWVFWGSEFYHRPENYLSNLEKFSLAYYRKTRTMMRNTRDGLARIVKKFLGIPVYDKQLLEEGYRSVTRFFSFLKMDFINVFAELHNIHAQWNPISFLSIEAMTIGIDLQTTRIGDTIMIGHAATPSDNHGEILIRLSSMKIGQQLFIPLEYGQDAYRQEVKRLARKHFNDRVEFLEQRLEMDIYYRRLSTIGYGIFNFKWQEGLGNILFLVWNGAKVFLQDESPVSLQFKQWGIAHYSIEHDLTNQQLSALLPETDRIRNKAIIEKLISAKKVEEYWNNLLVNKL